MNYRKTPLLMLSLASFLSFGGSVNATVVEAYEIMNGYGYNIRFPQSLVGKNVRCVLISKDGSEVAEKNIRASSKGRVHFIASRGMLMDVKSARCIELN